MKEAVDRNSGFCKLWLKLIFRALEHVFNGSIGKYSRKSFCYIKWDTISFAKSELICLQIPSVSASVQIMHASAVVWYVSTDSAN